LNISN